MVVLHVCMRASYATYLGADIAAVGQRRGVPFGNNLPARVSGHQECSMVEFTKWNRRLIYQGKTLPTRN